ncbi:hypothetical protein A8990_13010 [Paenibacillus taihuensis]|uniref:DUF1835 domain-containing protein n=1 Tax=Paenibacillus taihuensis TaxID=1156355 RepID=A0A3D9QY81_9BACL|nr:hypothetical protein [Paenibacillus taihuensis]REE70456.1 hypothetical protein A8990_13010 [Paenibacillus taihuensis]
MMLHVTNGDSTAQLLQKSSISGTILPWRESWIDGPAALDWWEEQAQQARAEWFERELGVPQFLYIEQCKSQQSQLTQAVMGGEEIVLWFEYDLFDQAMLAALLYWFSKAFESIPLNLSWIVATEVPGVADFRGLGQLSPEQVAAFWPQRREVATDEQAAAARAWAAYSAAADASDIDGREAITHWLRLDGEKLPVMAEALAFQLKRLPSEADSLGIVERLTLQELESALNVSPDADGVTPDKLFGAVSSALPMLGMGDLSYWSMLNAMAAGDDPLIQVSGDRPLPGFAAAHPINWKQWAIRLAPRGQRLLD